MRKLFLSTTPFVFIGNMWESSFFWNDPQIPVAVSDTHCGCVMHLSLCIYSISSFSWSFSNKISEFWFVIICLQEVPGLSISKALASSLRKPGVWTLPQVYLKAGSTLLVSLDYSKLYFDFLWIIDVLCYGVYCFAFSCQLWLISMLLAGHHSGKTLQASNILTGIILHSWWCKWENILMCWHCWDSAEVCLWWGSWKSCLRAEEFSCLH